MSRKIGQNFTICENFFGIVERGTGHAPVPLLWSCFPLVFHYLSGQLLVKDDTG
jgi:hypothetical protein